MLLLLEYRPARLK
ncbi:uncharacterized protein FFMR_01901 [Fusarium fujikuroi]|nr:uncharacterized protein FFMR_01901 [Fusarium fujikuroi]